MTDQISNTFAHNRFLLYYYTIMHLIIIIIMVSVIKKKDFQYNTSDDNYNGL